MKYDYNKLNILDVTKQVLIRPKPISLCDEHDIERNSNYLFSLCLNVHSLPATESTRWIDVSPTNGNSLALCGHSDINIFDKRESSIVKTFDSIHSGEFIWLVNKLSHYDILDWINCVRWSSSGDTLASASRDLTAKLWDFGTGKVLYTGITSDRSNFFLWKSGLYILLLVDAAVSVCFIWEGRAWEHRKRQQNQEATNVEL